MFWKNWPYWLKGGIILVIIRLILMLLAFINALGCSGWNCIGPAMLTFFPILTFLWGTGGSGFGRFFAPLSGFWFVIFELVSELILIFITGSVLGLIYEKIKKKKVS